MSAELNIVIDGLPESDGLRMQAFMRIGSERLTRRWSIGGEGDVRVMLYCDDMPRTVPSSLGRAPVAVRVVEKRERQCDGDSVLVRPLQFDDVITLLVSVEQGLAEGALEAVIAEPYCTANTHEAASVPANTLVEGLRAVAAAAAPASESSLASVPEPKLPASSPGTGTHTEVRLRRWPPATLLRNWRYGVRMASFMSARFLTVRELATLANVPEAECRQFVEALLAAGVLRALEHPEAAEPAELQTATAVASGATGSQAAVPAKVPVQLGILGRLRQKLGLAALRP